MSKVTAIVLTHNSAELINDCLASLAWVEEIIVVDDASSDATRRKVENKKRVKIVEGVGGFSNKRNLGAKEVKGDYLLYIDDDERIPPLLRKEIKSVVEKGKKDVGAYAFPRKNILLGHEMKRGGWSPDYVVRLIRRDALVSWEGELHEQPKVKGRVIKLGNPLTHISHRSLANMIEKTNEWSQIEAELLFEANHPKMNVFRFFSAGFREFWYRGIRKLGFLDGPVGVIEVIYQTISRMITYTKLWEMQLNKTS